MCKAAPLKSEMKNTVLKTGYIGAFKENGWINKGRGKACEYTEESVSGSQRRWTTRRVREIEIAARVMFAVGAEVKTHLM